MGPDGLSARGNDRGQGEADAGDGNWNKWKKKKKKKIRNGLITSRASRSNGRTLRRRGIPELLLLNRRDDSFDQNKVFSIRRPRPPSSSSRSIPHTQLSMEHLRGRAIRAAASEYGGVIDIDGDNVLELLLLTDLSLWRVDSYLTLSNITSSALRNFASKPSILKHNGLYTGANAFVALDYDNDGDWDMYVTLSATGHRSWIFWRVHDALFRNDGTGMYDNVIKESGVALYPAESRGVTAGDFDNDGWTDVFVSRYNGGDMLLLNNGGDGTFTTIWNIGFFKDDDGRRRSSTRNHNNNNNNVKGDMGIAVDYDRDGRLDLIVSEGSWDDRTHGGYYRVLRNKWHTGNGFLLVRVKSAPGGKATSLHALVKVRVRLKQVRGDGHGEEGRVTTMMRRVESPGTMVSNSYVETVHFGLGRASVVERVWVTWMDGSTASRTAVSVNATIVFGR